jgi:hypothetical protein
MSESKSLIEDLKREFYFWEYRSSSERDGVFYITFRGVTFSDTHHSNARSIARKHGFKLVQFGVRPTSSGGLFITFVFMPIYYI